MAGTTAAAAAGRTAVASRGRQAVLDTVAGQSSHREGTGKLAGNHREFTDSTDWAEAEVLSKNLFFRPLTPIAPT